MKPEEIRARAESIAQSVVSLGANPQNPERRARYIALIAPGETPAHQAEMATMSGCALVVAGIWRALGVESQRLDPPYHLGTAVSRLWQIANEAGAWVPFAEGRLPSPGDAVLVGVPPEIEHIYTVLTVTDGPTPTLTSVDGGQRDAHHDETIALKRRVFEGNRDVVDEGSDPGAATREGRTIRGWIDVTRLPIKATPESAIATPEQQQGPARLPPAVTPVTAAEMAAALRKAWTAQFGEAPRDDSLYVLIAQWALETDWGKGMHAYNVGNIKSVEADGRDYTYFSCYEILEGKTVWFYPDAPGCRFRAYRTLDDGVADYLATVHKRYAGAWSAVLSGDPVAYARLLKQERYYTGPESQYAHSLALIVNQLRRTLPAASGGASLDLYTTLGVQQALDKLGFSPGTLDGHDGPHTDAAVTAFQRAHGLTADGRIGPETRAALADALKQAADAEEGTPRTRPA